MTSDEDNKTLGSGGISRRNALHAAGAFAAAGSLGGLMGASGAASAKATPDSTPSDKRFQGRVAVITGGARGQGRSHAVALAREGANIVACDILEQIPTVAYPLATQADMDETARLVTAAGGKFVGLKADVRDAAAANTVIERATSEFGKVDFLLANAGIYTTGPMATMSDAMFDDVIRTNLYGVFNIMRAALPSMTGNGFGRIIATSSMAGRMGYANTGHYCASKWGVIGLAKAVALEVAKQGITVNSVCPSGVNTPLMNNAVNWREALADDPAPTREKYEAKMRANAYSPMGVPWVEPEEVTALMLFLLSDDARHITGTAIDVAAGGSASIPA